MEHMAKRVVFFQLQPTQGILYPTKLVFFQKRAVIFYKCKPGNLMNYPDRRKIKRERKGDREGFFSLFFCIIKRIKKKIKIFDNYKERYFAAGACHALCMKIAF